MITSPQKIEHEKKHTTHINKWKQFMPTAWTFFKANKHVAYFRLHTIIINGWRKQKLVVNAMFAFKKNS